MSSPIHVSCVEKGAAIVATMLECKLTAEQTAWAASRIEIADLAADRYSRRYRVDRDEVRSDAYWKVVELAGRIAPDDSRACDAFVFTAVANQILDASKVRNRQRQKFIVGGEFFADVPDQRGDRGADDDQAEHDAVAALVRGLPDRLRAVVTDCVVGGRSYSDFAAERGVAEKTAREWKVKAIERLRTAYRRIQEPEETYHRKAAMA